MNAAQERIFRELQEELLRQGEPTSLGGYTREEDDTYSGYRLVSEGAYGPRAKELWQAFYDANDGNDE